jgi:hypothetical protein
MPNECAAGVADPLAAPARRDAGDHAGRALDRSDETILRGLREYGASVDADDALHSKLRVGEQPTGVAPTARCIGLCSHES